MTHSDPRVIQVDDHTNGYHHSGPANHPDCPVCVWLIEQETLPIPTEVLSADRYTVQA